LGEKNIKIRGDSKLVLKQLTQEYKCVKEHLTKHFVIASSLLDCFDHVNIEQVPRLENQEANDLAQIASGYKMSKEKLTQLIEIKEKMVLQEPISEQLSMPNLWGQMLLHKLIMKLIISMIILKFLPLTLFHMMTGESLFWIILGIQQGMWIER
jgi:hypothetical protein